MDVRADSTWLILPQTRVANACYLLEKHRNARSDFFDPLEMELPCSFNDWQKVPVQSWGAQGNLDVNSCWFDSLQYLGDHLCAWTLVLNSTAVFVHQYICLDPKPIGRGHCRGFRALQTSPEWPSCYIPQLFSC